MSIIVYENATLDMKFSKLATLPNILLTAIGVFAAWLIFFYNVDDYYPTHKNQIVATQNSLGKDTKGSILSTPPSMPTDIEPQKQHIPSQSSQISQPSQRKSDAPDLSLVQRLASAPSAIKSAVKFKMGNFVPSPEIEVPIVGDLRVEIIDNKTICVVGDYHKFLQKRFLEECGDFMRGIDSPAANLASWSRDVFYNTLGAQIILKYRPAIAKAFQLEFAISDNVKILESGYWANPTGQATFNEVRTQQPRLTKNAFIAHFAFMKLAAPLQESKEYTITNKLGQSTNFTYRAEENLSGAIKVNQLGYSPEAAQKYAYVGAWLGSLGALDYTSRLSNAQFSICDASNNETVFSASLKRAIDDPIYKGETKFTGEVVYIADFSDFNKIGRYYIFVEGIGKSYDFEISNNAIGEAFYIHQKGLFHKRCGIDKAKPYTNWTMPKCHMLTYKSDFPPDDADYNQSKKDTDKGFFNANHESIKVSHFNLIASQANTKIAENVYGGWHDAADYDRRPYHFNVVCDLLAVYLYRPQNFSDNQLNIPESGNSIPDIIDEAVWGMRVWLAAQDENGGVGTWIEATSHPKDYNPSTDKQPYYLSAATRSSTMQYAAHASMLAIALKICGAKELSQTYLLSSQRAYKFAQNPENRLVKNYAYKDKNGQISPILYKERKEIPAEFTFKASFNLWLLTKDDRYLKECRNLETKMPQKFIEMGWRINPLFFAEFIKYGANVKELAPTYALLKKRTLMYADDRINMLKKYPYKIPWYSPTHAYVTYMSWGNFHPLRNAKYFVNAYEMTLDRKYRDAAFLCNDFHNGANPSGQTMTSGLGQNYPAQFLDLPSHTDGIDEYVQGITPYRNTFGIGRADIELAHALIYSPRSDRKFNPKPTMIMPPSIIGNDPDIGAKELSKKIGAAWPIWRRFANIEAYTVAASEYTVNETISPAAAVTGWLLSGDWKPSEKLKDTKPAADRTKLKGFAPLP